MSRALVTGGAGFIGSHLVDLLLGKGWEVVVLDDLSTGSMDNLPKHPKLTFEGRSILLAAATNIFDGIATLDGMILNADCVFHLAAIVGVKHVVARPLDTIDNNIECTSLVLRAAARYRKPTVIASSSEVYGNIASKLVTPMGLSEELPLLIPPPTEQRYGYAAAKLIDEYTALAHHRANGFPVVVARLFNTIGPRQTSAHGMVVPTFIEQALRNDPITVYGSGLQRRSFAWVGTVVQALYDLVRCEKAYGEIVNVGDTNSNVSMHGLACLIKDLTQSSSQITMVPYKDAYGVQFDDIHNRLPDLSKLYSLINLGPSVALSDMLRYIIDGYKLPLTQGIG